MRRPRRRRRAAAAESIDALALALRFSTSAAAAAVPPPPDLNPPRLDPSDVRSHNAALIAYSSRGSRAPRLAHLLASFGAMLKSGAPPNRCTYNTLINAHCKLALLADARAALVQMREAGLAPDTFTYNCLMLGLCRAGLLAAACGLFVQMPRRWGACYDRYSYTILIKGIKAHNVIYTSLVHGYCQVGDIDSAFGLMEKMASENCMPDVHTYNTLIDGLCKVKRLDRAIDLLDKMKKQGIEPTTCTFNILIKQMLWDKKHADAAKILRPTCLSVFLVKPGSEQLRRDGAASQTCRGGLTLADVRQARWSCGVARPEPVVKTEGSQVEAGRSQQAGQ
ncbi:hypothetical protein ZWY2020_058399 [Hordeum vulgare]|nr:hypothetical protein ZWY2020_058399 [Hordeum vulgare]